MQLAPPRRHTRSTYAGRGASTGAGAQGGTQEGRRGGGRRGGGEREVVPPFSVEEFPPLEQQVDMPRESELFLRELGRAQELVWVTEEELEKQAVQAVQAAKEGRLAAEEDWEKAEAQVLDAFGKDGRRKPSREEAGKALRKLLGVGEKEREYDGTESHTLRRRWSATHMAKVEKRLEWLRVESSARKLVNELLVEGGVVITQAVARLVTAPMVGRPVQSVQDVRRRVLAKYTRPGPIERERALVIRKNNEVVRVLGLKTHRTREEDEVLRIKSNKRERSKERARERAEREKESEEEELDVLGVLLASDGEEENARDDRVGEEEEEEPERVYNKRVVREMGEMSTEEVVRWLEASMRSRWSKSKLKEVVGRWSSDGIRGMRVLRLAEGGVAGRAAKEAGKVDRLTGVQLRQLVCAASTKVARVQSKAARRDRSASAKRRSTRGKGVSPPAKGKPVQDLGSGRGGEMGSQEMRQRGMRPQKREEVETGWSEKGTEVGKDKRVVCVQCGEVVEGIVMVPPECSIDSHRVCKDCWHLRSCIAQGIRTKCRLCRQLGDAQQAHTQSGEGGTEAKQQEHAAGPSPPVPEARGREEERGGALSGFACGREQCSGCAECGRGERRSRAVGNEQHSEEQDGGTEREQEERSERDSKRSSSRDSHSRKRERKGGGEEAEGGKRCAECGSQSRLRLFKPHVCAREGRECIVCSRCWFGVVMDELTEKAPVDSCRYRCRAHRVRASTHKHAESERVSSAAQHTEQRAETGSAGTVAVGDRGRTRVEASRPTLKHLIVNKGSGEGSKIVSTNTTQSGPIITTVRDKPVGERERERRRTALR